VERGEPVAAAAPAFAAGPGGWPGGFGARPGGNGGRPGPGGPRPGPQRDGGEVRLRLYLSGEPAVLLGPVVEAIAGRGAALSDVHIGEPTLEDVFIDLTGRGLR
jgi:ABC-2 type transport system ATP-binding protein